MCTLVPIGCLGHKITRIPALVPVSIFSLSIIGGKSKAEKHVLCAALRSAACGGASRRCAAPSAAARRFAPPLRGATRPARCARSPFANTKKMPTFSFLKPGGTSVSRAVFRVVLGRFFDQILTTVMTVNSGVYVTPRLYLII